MDNLDLQLIPLIYLLFAFPIIGGFLSLKWKMASVISSLADVFISIYLLLYPNVEGFFFIDEISKVFLIMNSSITFITMLYSQKYIRDGIVKERWYYFLFMLYSDALYGVITLNNLGLIWASLEASTALTVILVAYEKGEVTMEATWRYAVIVSMGVSIAFVSIILFYYGLHTLTLTSMIGRGTNSPLIVAASLLGILGFGTKAGIFPGYTWLPDAHTEAPATVSSSFSAVLVPAAAVVVFRIYQIAPFMKWYFLSLSAFSLLTASLMMARQRYFKRLFAYSTLENVNLGLIGLIVSQPLGALLLFLTHAFGKTGAFLSSGVYMEELRTKKIEDVEKRAGLSRPTNASLFLSSLAVTGTPPFGTFLGELLIFIKVSQISLPLLAVMLASAAIAFVSVNYNVTRMLKPKEERKYDGILGYISLASALISLIIGVVALEVIQ